MKCDKEQVRPIIAWPWVTRLLFTIALHFTAASHSVTIPVDEYDHFQTGTLIDL